MIPDPVPSSRMFGDSKFLNISIASQLTTQFLALEQERFIDKKIHRPKFLFPD
ncbi:MAG: hypothetical protein Ct9H90mP13_00100 [Pseudomonadota bacterium]|nr:MAG: hypothetical protein Ct9H90mP13_00100 [Pseudomonadota bacterium]